MTDLMNFINNILWGSVLIYLLLGTGIYFTLRTRFIQLRHFSHMFSVLKNSNKSDSAGISSFRALCTTLAARVGTGNLTGVAIALTAGGPAPSSGCGWWRLSAWPPPLWKARWRSSTKPKTITATTAAARPTTWKRASACAGWACCFPSS